MSVLLQDLIVGGVALGAATTVVWRSWAAFAARPRGSGCGSCGNCPAAPTTPDAAAPTRPASPQVHPLTLIRSHSK